MKLKVILNPRSKNGRGKYLVPLLKERFTHSLLGIEQPSHPQHATAIARRAAEEGADTIVAVGGDGTVNAVINGIAGRDVALGIIPTGTANDLASLYHTPTDPSTACDIILERHLQHADLICVNGRYYITGGGLGLPCKVAEMTNAMRRPDRIKNALQHIFGSQWYLFATLYEALRASPTRNPLNIQWNGHSLFSDPLALLINNQPFIGKHFRVSPGAVNDDGMFDICLVERPKRRIQILSTALKTLTASHLDSPYVKRWRASELIIESPEPVEFFGDGDVFEKTSEFTIKIFPRAINLITPKNKTMEE